MSSTFRAIKSVNIPVDNPSRLQLRRYSSSRAGSLKRESSAGNASELLSKVNFRNPVNPAKVSGSITPASLLSARLIEVNRGSSLTFCGLNGWKRRVRIRALGREQPLTQSTYQLLNLMYLVVRQIQFPQLLELDEYIQVDLSQSIAAQV